MTKRAFALSFLLHLSLFLLTLTLSGSGQGDSDNPSDGVEGTPAENLGAFIPKRLEVVLEEPEEVSISIVQKPKAKPSNEKSPDRINKPWYGGIGIRSDSLYRIFEIATGYAADRAGLLVGDRIVSNGNTDFIRGDPGTTVELYVERQGALIHFRIVREKICTEV